MNSHQLIKFMNANRINLIILIFCICLAVYSCSGDGAGPVPGNNNEDPPDPVLIHSVFLDSPVNGLAYLGNPSGKSGITGQSGINGGFTVVFGDTVTFRLGNLVIGSTAPLFTDNIVTPVSLTSFTTNPPSPEAVRIAQLLQSLDLDKNPLNGITIVPDVRNRLQDGSVDVQTLQTALQDGNNFDGTLGGMIQHLTSGNANRNPNDIVMFNTASAELSTGMRLVTRLNFIWPTDGVPVAFIDTPFGGISFNDPVHTISLNGTRSFDPDNQPFTYMWSISSQPPGANSTLSSPAFVDTDFSFSIEGDYTVLLKVTDSSGLSSSDDIEITYEGTTITIRF